MGGSGSTRWNVHKKKYTVEDSLVLKMKSIHSSLKTSRNGTITWSRNDEQIARIAYQILTGRGNPVAVHLNYTWNGKAISYAIALISTLLPWGRARYWFSCPNSGCGRRVANLYLAPGSPYFACRTCHQLTYRSCQETGQSDDFLKSMTEIMQGLYPGISPKDVSALLENRNTDHLQQILLQRTLNRLENLPDPYEHYLSADELCRQSGLSQSSLEQLSAVRLLIPDHRGMFRPKLLQWAIKLAALLDDGWQPTEIKRWAKGRFKSANPKQWPPRREDWQFYPD